CPPSTVSSTLSLHDALPIYGRIHDLARQPGHRDDRAGRHVGPGVPDLDGFPLGVIDVAERLGVLARETRAGEVKHHHGLTGSLRRLTPQRVLVGEHAELARG